MSQALQHVGVLVPVRNEEELLPRCLDALAEAVAQLRADRPTVTLRVAVVLDGCTDGSRAVLDRTRLPDGMELVALPTPALGVGAARAAGARLLLRRAAADGVVPAAAWLASTDADSAVPRAWLSAQVEAADAGADAWIGTVEMPTDHPAGSVRARLAARWSSHQRHHEGHEHVHGANLGVRGSVYLAAGGFTARATGEDVLLVERLGVLDAVLVRTARHPVVTSDRCEGRAPDGVATDLAALVDDGPADPRDVGPDPAPRTEAS